MYGNTRLPGIATSEVYREKGSLWRGYPEATWFKIVSVAGTTSTKLSRGTILKEDISTGYYSPISTSDIISTASDLPGTRLVIVADDTAVTGSTETEGEGQDAVTTQKTSAVLVGIQGQVDKAQLLIGETAFTELTDEQQVKLNTQLEAWGFILINVFQGE